jgi:hypothetical protein
VTDLIQALTIFASYMDNTRWPTICQHDQLIVRCEVPPESMRPGDAQRLYTLGFNWNSTDGGYWHSFHFGSA